MTDRELEEQVLALLPRQFLWLTKDVLAAVPDVEGWRVRRTLDRLAEDGRVYRTRGKRAGSYAWSASPSPRPDFATSLQETE